MRRLVATLALCTLAVLPTAVATSSVSGGLGTISIQGCCSNWRW